MTITARFASRCPRCSQTIEIGTSVEWARGSAARHITCPPKPAAAPTTGVNLGDDDIGVYVLPDGTIAKVQASKSNPGRFYAQKWVEIRGERLNEKDAHVKGEYQRSPGLVYRVAESGRRMTLDEAKAFILRYGQCARCGRRLKAADSVERGIGPICIQYFPEGTTAVSLMGAKPMTSATDPETVATRSRWSRPGDDELEDAAYAF